MPKTESEVWLSLTFLPEDVRVVIEEVSGYIGGAGHPGSAMFNFGWGYGGLRMALIAMGLQEGEDWVSVRPRVWQKALNIHPRYRAESKQQWKTRLKKEAERRFPWIRTTLKTCDAVLLAEYCRIRFSNKGAANASR
jgi:hypothetical protein